MKNPTGFVDPLGLADVPMVGGGCGKSGKDSASKENSSTETTFQVPDHVEIPSLKEQAKEIQHKLNSDKTSVTIRIEQHKIHTHYDLSGPTHKGVETPHKQYSKANPDHDGIIHYNKLRKRKDTHKMTQQDIRLVRRYLERKDR